MGNLRLFVRGRLLAVVELLVLQIVECGGEIKRVTSWRLRQQQGSIELQLRFAHNHNKNSSNDCNESKISCGFYYR